jgi:hypothetical protein
MITSASTKIRSSDDGIRQPKPPLDADEWLVDYRRGLEAKIQSRKPPEGDPEWLDRIAVMLEK